VVVGDASGFGIVHESWMRILEQMLESTRPGQHRGRWPQFNFATVLAKHLPATPQKKLSVTKKRSGPQILRAFGPHRKKPNPSSVAWGDSFFAPRTFDFQTPPSPGSSTRTEFPARTSAWALFLTPRPKPSFDRHTKLINHRMKRRPRGLRMVWAGQNRLRGNFGPTRFQF